MKFDGEGYLAQRIASSEQVKEWRKQADYALKDLLQKINL